MSGHGRIRLTRPGMGVTLDGIAKGYVVHRVSDVLAADGIDNHLVNAGGDIRARTSRDDQRQRAANWSAFSVREPV